MANQSLAGDNTEEELANQGMTLLTYVINMDKPGSKSFAIFSVDSGRDTLKSTYTWLTQTVSQTGSVLPFTQ